MELSLINLEEFPIDLKTYPNLQRRSPKRYSLPIKPGDIFHQNTIIGLAGIQNTHTMWLCRCKCGVFHLLAAGYVLRVKGCKNCGLKRQGGKGLPGKRATHTKITRRRNIWLANL